MEPTDLNPDSREDDELKAFLQSHAPEPILRDDGFSQRVLAALPSPRRRAPVSPVYPLWLWLAGGLTGVLVAALKGASFEGLSVAADAFALPGAELVHVLSDPWLGLALALTGVSLVVSFVFVRGFRLRF